MSIPIPKEKRKEIAAFYTTVGCITTVANKYHTSRETVRKILKEEAGLVEEFQKKKAISCDQFLQNLTDDASRVQEVVGLYMNELRNPTKVKKASPKVSSTVIGIMIDKQLRIKDYELKKQEIELRKREIAAMEKGYNININPAVQDFSGGKRDDS